MPLITLQAIYVVISLSAALLGLLLHESLHFVFGKLFRGGAFVNRYSLGVIPTQIGFRDPESMKNWQVRVAGGCVFIFPLIILVTAIFTPFLLISEIEISKTTFFAWWIISMTCAGGSTVSWYDILAVSEPEKWKRYTAGKPIKHDSVDKL